MIKSAATASLTVATSQIFSNDAAGAASDRLAVCIQNGNPNKWAWMDTTPLLEGYASTWSVAVGGLIRFSLLANFSDSASPATISVNVIRIGKLDENKKTATFTVQRSQWSIPFDVVQAGCGLPDTWSLPIPTTWKSGLYLAKFSLGTNYTTIPFVTTGVAKVYTTSTRLVPVRLESLLSVRCTIFQTSRATIEIS